MDPQPHTVHATEHHEDSSLQKTPRDECMCQVVDVLLPWRIFMVEPSYNSLFDDRIMGLRMQGPDPQDLYPGKAMDHSLSQRIKDTYGDVEKGMRGYKVSSIESVTVCLTCQMIAGKLVHKN
jgi:hypothetical protein